MKLRHFGKFCLFLLTHPSPRDRSESLPSIDDEDLLQLLSRADPNKQVRADAEALSRSVAWAKLLDWAKQYSPDIDLLKEHKRKDEEARSRKDKEALRRGDACPICGKSPGRDHDH